MPRLPRGRGWRALALLLLVLLVLGAGAFLAGERLLAQVGINLPKGEPGLAGLRLPPGFVARVWADGLNGPRLLTSGPNGAVLVAERQTGRILALRDADGDGRAEQHLAVLSDLQDPTSVAYVDGWLYAGETTRVTRARLGNDLLATERQIVVDDLPAGGVHATRTVLVTPGGQLYVATGSSCNVCQESEPHRASVWLYPRAGGGGHLFARGLRNAVGLALNPWTQEVWATNNGRDFLGDDLPPETVYAVRDGADYGWPRCHAGRIADPAFGGTEACRGVEAPLVEFQAHMAPLGLAFYNAPQFPAAYRDSLYVAFHGSWNRSAPVGYKVMRVPLQGGQVAGPAEDFATGWLKEDGSSWGRPVGLAVSADGALLVSDDKAGVIYRITYERP